MIKSKKQSLIVIGAFLLVMLLTTVTYAFFNYTRTGAANTIRVGRISFESKNEQTISLSNLFPIDPSNTTDMNDNTKVGTYSIDIEGDTDYVDGIEYLVSITNANIYTLTGKTVPISINVTTEDLGSPNANYFTARESKDTLMYKKIIGDTIVGDGMLLVGYIPQNNPTGTAEGIDGSITIKAYLDENKILISDTYDGTESDNMGTPNSLAQGKTVLTTSEWNSLQSSGLSFKVKVEANEGIWVPLPSVVINYNANGGTVSQASKTIPGDSTTYGALAEPTPDTGYLFAGWYTEANGGTPVTSTTAFTNSSATTLYAHYALESSIKCKRVINAANLNTETCTNSSTSSYCQADGYAYNSTITYGNAKELGSELTVGDAFDCNVNGTGYNERFYYVSPYFDTQATLASGETRETRTSTFDNSYATLIYYKNFVSGSPSDEGAAYATKADAQAVGTCTNTYVCNWYGPVTALTHLPSTSTWSNITLKTTSRAILAEEGSTHNTTATSGGQLPTAFSYEGKAARLLTAQELMNGCSLSRVGSNTAGELSARCQFLFERTRYANTNTTLYPTYGPWLETPHASETNRVWYAFAGGRRVSDYIAYDNDYGVRPAIDVPMSAILK